MYAVVRDRKKISKGGGNGGGKYALDFDLVSVGMPVAASGALFGVCFWVIVGFGEEFYF